MLFSKEAIKEFSVLYYIMTEQQIDFKKIVAAFKSNKFTPDQLGSLFRQYYVKYLKDDPPIRKESLNDSLNEAAKLFDGGLFSH